MMPISDDNRGRRSTPIVSWTLIALNLAIYAFQFTMSERQQWNFLQDWAVFPTDIMDGQKLHTLVTCAFLHGSWMHVLGNMLFLWVFGDNVEDVMGHAKYLVFYLLSAVGASLAQVLVDTHSNVPMVGASGAVSAVLAAYIIMFPKGRIKTLIFLGIFAMMRMIPAWVVIGLWIAMQIFSGVTSIANMGGGEGGVAYFAHIGGFAVGAVLVFLFRDKAKQDAQNAAREGLWMDPQRYGYQRNRGI